MPELIIGIAILVVLGLYALGYFVAGRWWSGGLRAFMGFVIGTGFVLLLVGVLVGGCTILVFTQ